MADIEEQIQKAMREGKFDDLPGKGKPLRLDENPHEDPEWRLAYHLLHSNGYSLPWIELRREIETETEKARAGLRQTWDWRQAKLGDPGLSHAERAQMDAEWRRVEQDFRQQVEVYNRRIRAYNLQAPSAQFHLRLLDCDLELRQLPGFVLDS